MSEILNEQALLHAAKKYAESMELDEPFNKYAANDFKEGAKWQKEQYKELIPILRKCADLCYDVNEKSLSDQLEIVLKKLES